MAESIRDMNEETIITNIYGASQSLSIVETRKYVDYVVADVLHTLGYKELAEIFGNVDKQYLKQEK